MEGVTFKFLAKRRKEEGLISSLLVAEYRQKVQEFEAGFLPKRGSRSALGGDSGGVAPVFSGGAVSGHVTQSHETIALTL